MVTKELTHNKNIKSRPLGLDSQSAALSALYVGRYESIELMS